MADEVLYEKAGAVAVVTLNRPDKRNAVNPALAAALDAAVKRSESDPSIRACILASSSDRVFCAGADLATIGAGEAAAIVTADGGFAGFVLARRTRPWIAAVRGVALGGGMELSLACDMTVCSDDATFGLPEPKHGLLAGAGGVTRLPRSIPRRVAIEMITTGDAIDADRALELGLVNRVVPSAQVLEAALELAGRIASNAPLAVQHALALVRDAELLDDAAAQARTDEMLAMLHRSEDSREGPRAFMEKRPPVWRGR